MFTLGPMAATVLSVGKNLAADVLDTPGKLLGIEQPEVRKVFNYAVLATVLTLALSSGGNAKGARY